MNKFITALAVSALAVPGVSAGVTSVTSLPEGAISDVAVERSASSLLVSMNLHPEVFSKKHNRETLIRPVIVSGSDSLWLSPVIVAGRARYYQNLRSDGADAPYALLRAGSKNVYSYSETVPYEDWMEKGKLDLVSEVTGCCGDGLTDPTAADMLAFDFREKTLSPRFTYKKPEGEIEKTRHVDGEANIDFPVNKTVILPDFRNNPQELARILNTIDEIRNDKDVTITSLAIKGFASPEGPYLNNERLAKGRTESLVEYVRKLYAFPRDVMKASWEAEDWAGLEKRVRASNIDNRDKILEVISDSSLTPDQKDAAIMTRFPEQYRFMLENWYPALRHSAYNVKFIVKDYTDVKEIADVMKTAPQKLSLEELFIYAQSLDQDSPEFREVMQVAVRMFPDNPVANLNAATTAAEHEDFELARKYLAKAGDSPEAFYVGGVVEAQTGNYPKAQELLTKASALGITDANRLIDDMRDWGWIK